MSRRPRIDDIYQLALPEQPAISPDGGRIVYVLRSADRDGDQGVSALWQIPAAGGEATQLTRGRADAAPAWSPDGSSIAFLRGGEGPAQLWLLPAAGGEPGQLTSLPLGAGTPVWSPDGSAIAFAAPVDIADRENAATAPMVTNRLLYKADGAGLLGTMRKHVHVLDVASREVRQITSGDWHAGDPSWSPDGTRLAFSAMRAADADLTLRTAAYVIEVEPRNAQPRLVGSAEGMAGPVTWTADGESLLVVGRLDTEPGHAGLLRVALDGGAAVNLIADLDRSVMPGAPGYPGALPRLTPDGSTVLLCLRDNGYTHLYAVDVDGGAPRCLVGGACTVSGLAVGGDTAATVLGTPTSFGEIATVDLASGTVTPRTTHGDAEIELFAREERQFTISDGTVVRGWLVRDTSRDGPRPLLLDVHGGPHNAWNGAADPVHLYHQALAERGWVVLLLNPRASDGYGEAFYTAAVGAWGQADARDLLEPIDQLVADGTADADRLAVTGYSYGGYMTCYLTAHDDRFAAAVAGGVVSDLAGVVGTSDVGPYLGVAELGGTPWTQPERYAAQTPAVERVRTPTLVVHGADDMRCPVGQAEQWFAGLRQRGVPTRLVLYPGSSHLFVLDGAPSHRADWNRRVVDWVEQYANRRVPIDAAHWQQRLAELTTRHRVPGAALGILRVGEEPVITSCGVLSKATGVEVTDDTLFQIGSITKVWTTTVLMQLVDEGKLDLDAPIADVLPELRLADPDVTKQVAMRHLLSHTSGIDGDVFTDTGRGDDCLERYVDQLDQAGQNHPLGVTFSYCNSGFILAGRVIEKLTGQTWDEALRERLFAPLGLEHTVTLPEQALLFRAAVGHVAEGEAEPQPAPVWVLPRSAGPAGLITASAADVLAFAAMHLRGGVAADGTRVLSEASAAAMAEQQVELPDQHTLGDSWGLGWIRFGWDGHRLIGHDGNTLGQAAFLRILPSQRLAVTLLTNGGNTHDLYEDLYREIVAELAGIAMPHPIEPAAEPPTVDATRHLGGYERASARIEVLDADGTLRLRQTVTGPLAELVPEPTQELDLVPISDTVFAVREPGTTTWVPVTFYALPSGEPYVHYGVRATPKVS